MAEWPTPQDLYERYQYADQKMQEAVKAGDTQLIQFYAGQLSVLGLFVDDDVDHPEIEIAVYSPTNRHHETFKVFNIGEEWENIEWAEKYRDSYKEQAKTGGIHADKDAIVVYRHVTGWQKLEERNK
jgi:hypothetical protein